MPNSKFPPGPSLLSPRLWFLIFQPTRYYDWLRRRYGDIATVRIPGKSAVVVLTPEGARQVFSADPNNYNAVFKEAFSAIAGPRSLLVLEGASHHSERLLLLSAFHAGHVAYGHSIREITTRHTDAWRPGETARAYAVGLGIAREVILRVVLGLDPGPLLDQARGIVAKLTYGTHPLPVFFAAFRGRWFPPWARYLRTKKEFSVFIAQRLAERRANGGLSRDVLGLMMAARREDGTPMSDDEIQEKLIPIIFAGHQTTAFALAWALYELGRHPEVLAKLREELDALGPDPDPDIVARQSYLQAVCAETLRHHTTVSEIVRVTRVARQLLGYSIPANTNIAVSLSAIHRDQSVFSEPQQFRPERFIERKYGPYEYVRFGGGHRRCPGANLAEYQLALMLATIVSRWNFELAGTDSEVRHDIGTGPRNGVRMMITGRRDGLQTSTSVVG